MTRKAFLPAAVVVAMASATGTTRADMIGAHAEVMTGLGTPEGYVTHRVYVDFDDATDKLMAILHDDNGFNPPLEIFTNDCQGVLNDPDSVFAGTRPEDLAWGPPITAEWDSWVTIGAEDLVGNNTAFSCTFAGGDGLVNVITGTHVIDDSGGGWHNSQLRLPANGGTVLIAQFTVREGFSFRFVGYAFWRCVVRFDTEITAFIVQPTTVPGAACIADVDVSAEVGFTDLLAVLAAWGACPDGCVEDIDGDLVVGFPDLLAVLCAWGPCACE